MQDEKYLVFKKDEFIERHGTGKVVEALPDATVIRAQDAFATGGLYAYANNIQTALELSRRDLPVDVRESLERARDYFFDRAHEAERLLQSGRSKLPD